MAHLGLAEVQQSEPGGDARHANGAQVVVDVHLLGVDLVERCLTRGAHHAVLLPAAEGVDNELAD